MSNASAAPARRMTTAQAVVIEVPARQMPDPWGSLRMPRNRG